MALIGPLAWNQKITPNAPIIKTIPRNGLKKKAIAAGTLNTVERIEISNISHLDDLKDVPQ